jgi:hypothetical protein
VLDLAMTQRLVTWPADGDAWRLQNSVNSQRALVGQVCRRPVWLMSRSGSPLPGCPDAPESSSATATPTRCAARCTSRRPCSATSSVGRRLPRGIRKSLKTRNRRRWAKGRRGAKQAPRRWQAQSLSSRARASRPSPRSRARTSRIRISPRLTSTIWACSRRCSSFVTVSRCEPMRAARS